MPATRDLETLLRVARLYHVQRQSQKQIASALGTSRSNVSRMLTAALDHGLVEVRVLDPSGRDLALERALRDTFVLDDVRVLTRSAPGGADDVQRVGEAGAALLLETLHDGMTVAMSWGTALQAMVWAVRTERQYSVRLVQLVGGLSSIRNEISGQELVRELSARLGGARAEYLHAPATMTSPSAVDALLAENQIQATLARARSADVAFVGIGTPTHGSSAAIVDSLHLTPDELRDFEAQRPVGDIAARYFTAEGHPLSGPVAARVMAVSADDLRAVPTVVGLAAGRVKAPGVLGALRGGLVNVLVCDDALARAVLSNQRTPVRTSAPRGLT